MGKRSTVLLTKRVVDAARPDRDRYHIWDSELPGFGLRVAPSGVKTFIIKYRTDGGGRSATQRIMSIGHFGPITVEQARRAAKTKLGCVAAGQDPAEDLQIKRRDMTISDLIDLYEKQGCFVRHGRRQGEPMKPKTKTETVARLRNHVMPLLAQRKSRSLNPGDIEGLVADVASGKTAREVRNRNGRRIVLRGGVGMAGKVARDLSVVFSFAIRHEIVTTNPVTHAIFRKIDNRRMRFLTVEELASLGAALDELEMGKCNPKGINIIRLLALTGCRRSEIAGLEWSEVNLAKGLIELEDSKTGPSTRPLGGAAIDLLKSIPKEGSKFVFPAERGEGHFTQTPVVWCKAVAKAQISGATLHTLRHTVGSIATCLGESLALTGAIPGHARLSSTEGVLLQNLM
ncbi:MULTISPECIES: tyrosine-type recombinase/integrase [Rhizobium]|uniref:Integrase n=1 Tax=Rhizobium tropici TaxID=398 RepID=A0A6P1C9K3_RHITR|nr:MULTISPECIES: site-specific integrase [Rhizobium]AGB74392.1 phage integrase family protein [Rhizobium tropici CIAT 899]MBB4240873.1 integrase [Rhizobium tropici]MBB5591710.1 integrase [Rhizobium tropici]MBB6490764.1 integrase [Rhizobium tropici]NEV12243.1 site-specific integrase [Rhizobium tropici]